jgi:hypothetical protein
MAGESDAALGRLEVLIGRWKTEGQDRCHRHLRAATRGRAAAPRRRPGRRPEGRRCRAHRPRRRSKHLCDAILRHRWANRVRGEPDRGKRGPHLEDAKQDDQVHGQVQRGRQRHHRPLGAAGRQRGLAALDGHHLDQAGELIKSAPTRPARWGLRRANVSGDEWSAGERALTRCRWWSSPRAAEAIVAHPGRELVLKRGPGVARKEQPVRAG